MDFSNITLSTCKYKVDKLQIFLPSLSEPFDVPVQMVGKFSIDSDYDNYYYPFFEITVEVPNKLARMIRADKNNCDVYLKISKAYFKPESASEENTNAYRAYTKFIDDRFYALMDDETPDVKLYDEKLEAASDIQGLTYDSNNVTEIIFLLYNKNYFFKPNQIVNDVLRNVNLNDATAFILNKCGLKNVLMAPSDNNTIYRQFIITPEKAKTQLEKICNEYAFHVYGTTIFYDLNRMYIVNKSPECKAWELGENRVTHLSLYRKAQQNSQAVQGCFKNVEECYDLVSLDRNYIRIIDSANVNDQIVGNNFFTINAEDGTITEKYGEIDASNDSPVLSNVLINNFGHDTSNSVYKRLYEAKTSLTATLSGIDVSMLTPNKEFKLSLDISNFAKYCKSYRITKASFAFVKSDNFYTATGICTFKG